jgi:hypothetical protein
MTTSVFAEEKSYTSNIPTGEPPISNQNTANYRQQQNIAEVLIITSMIVSLLIGIFLMTFMIKHSAKIPNLVMYGLLFIGSIVWSIFMIFSLLFQFLKYGGIPDPDIIEMGWPFFILLVFSGYLTFNLIKKEDFAQKMKYTLSLSFGGIIASVLAILSLMTIAFIFSLDGLSVGILGILIFAVGSIGSFILGIIGFFIDKSRK